MMSLVSHADLLLFTATANLSIVSLNLSLMLNRVGFYQARCSILHALSLSKLLIADERTLAWEADMQ